MYVLIENDEVAGISPLGIFDSPDKAKEKLHDFYNEFSELEYKDIRDSGIEWQMKIIADSDIIILTLYEFTINEI